jgi:4-diphosphocytidyl-2-C-methyl-D-erythritol kinase
MKTVKIKAYAKVNLTLEIVGQKPEYHALDSLVASVDLFDLIVLKARKDKLSSVTMKGMGSESIPPETNNALKAAESFSKTFGVNGADITVYKNIPLGAGLGGSSADASGVLNGMAKLYGVDDREKIAQLADTLGSDTRYMLDGGFARMQGRGGEITPIESGQVLHFLAICPKDGCSSGACYREYDRLNSEKRKESYTQNAIDALKANDALGLGRYLTNDLFLPATSLCESVKKAYEEASSFSPLGTVMTGSGSCVLAMFETKELCEWAKSRYRGKFRSFVLKTVVPKKVKEWKNPFVLEE